MRLDTESLRAFVSALEFDGMTNAADELGVSQSAVSWRIRRLEDRVGTDLLIREGHSLRPTQAGSDLCAYAQTIIEAHDSAVRMLESTSLEGTVRLGSSDDHLAERVAYTLGRFRQAHPLSRVEFHIHHSLVLDQMLAADLLDLALYFVLEPDVEPDDEVLTVDDLVWVVGENAPKEFDVVPLLSFGEGSVTARTTVTTLRAVGMDYSEAFTGSSFPSILSALRAGLGVSLIDRANMTDGIVEWPVAADLPSPPNICQVVRLGSGSVSELAKELYTDIVRELGTGLSVDDEDS